MSTQPFDLGLVGDLFDGLDATLSRVNGVTGSIADITNSGVGIARGVADFERAGDDQDFREAAQDAFVLGEVLSAERGDSKQVMFALAAAAAGVAVIFLIFKR